MTGVAVEDWVKWDVQINNLGRKLFQEGKQALWTSHIIENN